MSKERHICSECQCAIIDGQCECPDLDVCPKCGGPADNGNDRCVPPAPYICSRCTTESERDYYKRLYEDAIVRTERLEQDRINHPYGSCTCGNAEQCGWCERQQALKRIVELETDLKKLQTLLRELRALDVRCTCGSGGHPRICKRHPWGYERHCMELNTIGWEEENEELERRNTELEAELECVKAGWHAHMEHSLALEERLADAKEALRRARGELR